MDGHLVMRSASIIFASQVYSLTLIFTLADLVYVSLPPNRHFLKETNESYSVDNLYANFHQDIVWKDVMQARIHWTPFKLQL